MGFLIALVISSFTVLKSDAKSLVFEVVIDSLDTETVYLSGNQKFLFIHGGDNPVSQDPGTPYLPTYTFTIGLPPDGEPHVDAIVEESEVIRLNCPIMPVPYFENDGLSPFYQKGETYKQKGFFPSDVLDSVEIAWLRTLRVASIRLHPFQYDPATNTLKFNRRIIVRVDYGNKKAGNGVLLQNDPFEGLYRSKILNYEVAKYWHVLPKPPKQTDPFEQAQVWLKIAVISDGIYEITGSDLQQLGLEGISVNAIRLFSFGPDSLPSDLSAAETSFVEVPIKIEDGGDGILDPNDRILFFGSAAKGYYWDGSGYSFKENPYSDTVFYWLGINTDAPPREIRLREFATSGNSVDEHLRYFRHEINLINLAQKGLWWLGEEIWRFQREPSAELSVSFDLPNLIGSEGEMRIVLVAARSEQVRWIYLLVNDEVVDSFTVETGRQPVSVSRTIHLSNLRAQGNNFTLRVVAPTTYIENDDHVILDYFDIKYRAANTLPFSGSDLVFFDTTLGVSSIVFDGTPAFVWDVTDPMNPIELRVDGNAFVDSVVAGLRYCVAKSASKPIYIKLANIVGLRTRIPSDVDYLIIVPSEFASAARQLAEWRSQNLLFFEDSVWTIHEGDVWTVKLEDIFEEFGFGSRDPTAIRNFVKFVYDHTEGGLKYLVLVGDATYDYKGYSASGGNYLPPYEPWMLLWVESPGYSAFDDFYADVVGGEGLADVFIGRIPVRSDAELLSYTEKVIAYERKLSMGMWRDRVVLVADDEFGSDQQRPSDGWIHMGSIDQIYRTEVPDFMETKHVYMIEFPRPQPYVRLGASESFIKTFNKGSLLMFIFIHGNPVQLAHEELFKLEKHADLINAGLKNPFVFIASCKVGAFERIRYPRCVAEDWAIRSGGAIATLSSTGLTLPSQNERYALDIFELLNDCGLHSLGELNMVGKLWGYSGYAKYYVLLGDPAVPIALPTPDIEVSIDDSLRKGERITWNAVVDEHVGGELYARSYGVKRLVQYVMPVSGRIYYYMRPPDAYFVGRVYASDSLSGSFFVHVSVDTGSPSNFVLFYPRGGEHGRVGCATGLRILPQQGLPTDDEPPRVALIYNGRNLEDGDKIPMKPILELRLADESGLNLSKSIGGAEPGLSFWLDASASYLDLTDYFEYDFNSDTSGSAVFRYEFPSEGGHLIRIRAYDNFENLGVYDWQVEVVGEEEQLKIVEPLVYPNPVDRVGPVKFGFGITADAYVRVSIFTISGRLIWQSSKQFRHKGEYEPIVWNGLDADGDEPANGLYFFVIEAEDSGGNTVKVIDKFVIAK